MKKLWVAAVILPQPILRRLARRFDTPGAFELPELGSAFWMDASYLRWTLFDRIKTARKRFL